MVMRRLLKWSLLVAATVGVTYPLTLIGVPSAALFAALVVGVALALLSLAPSGIPRPAGDCRAGRARRLHRHDGPPGRGRRARSALADRRGRRDRHPAAERRVRRAAGDAPRRHPVDGVVGPGGRRRVRAGRDRPRTRRRRPRRVGGAVPAGRVGDGVDARGGDAGLPRRQDRTRTQPRPKPTPLLGI